MALVSMKQAAEMAGVGRTTLYRKAEKGLLSMTTMPDGSRKVDTAELYRVFPPDSTEDVEVVHEGSSVDMLKKEVEYLKELLLQKDRIIEGKDQTIEVQAQALRMLEHKPQPEPTPPSEPPPAPKRVSWLGRLFGRS
jgi:predicted site-specific integrase-resolvase